MRRKLQSLVLMLLALLLPATAAAYDFEVDGIYYDINGNEATVTSGTSHYTGDVTIPAAVTYNGTTYSVTAIGDHAFFDCYRLARVTIPSSVTAIGTQAFAYCSGLMYIIVDSGNRQYDCRNNCNAIIETASNTLIVGCENTIIPNSVIAIGEGAFEGRDGLMCVDIPSSVTFIDHHAFWGCGLTSVQIPNTVTFIGEGAFSACTDMTSIIVDGGNRKYDSRNNCNAIIETASNTLLEGCKSTIIPNTVTAIGKNAFDCCFGLTSIDIPNSVVSIGDYAFLKCSHLTGVKIPNSVTSIGKRPFDMCYDLISIIVDSGNPRYDSRNNCNAIIENASNTLIVGCETSTIPNSVASIGDYAFYLVNDLTSIDIPNSVTTIGYHAFDYCHRLTSVTIGNSVTSIGNCAFYKCNSLSDVYCFIDDPSAVSMGIYVFSLESSDYSGRTLHVPHGTAAAYQADENWYPYFGQIVEMEPETGLIGDVNLDGEVDIADINVVVDIITGGDDYTPTADVNGDGEINISDVNAIINIIHKEEALIEEHEWVDLGLPSGTLWATCNVGASAPEEYGDYFAWGETEPKDFYDWSTYKWCNGSNDSLTKYCSTNGYGVLDYKRNLDPEDDAAYVNWGPAWRMPTHEQQVELMNVCTWSRTTLNGVNGFQVTGPNGNKLFLPLAGERSGSQLIYAGSSAGYWPETLFAADAGQIMYIYGNNVRTAWTYRCEGWTVRAIRSPLLIVEQQNFDFGEVPIGQTRKAELTIVNNTAEAQTLTVSADEPFLLEQEEGCASSITIVVPGNSSNTVMLVYTATEPGEFNGNVTFRSPVFDGGQRVIPVQAFAYSGNVPEHRYVDLGLPSGTLWATCNVGASAPEEYGDYFAWGETEPKEVYNLETYKWFNVSDQALTKYCTDSNFGIVDNLIELYLDDDAASVNWGPSWCMPTEDQFLELSNYCSKKWTRRNGVYGYLFIGPSGNTLFLPTAGKRIGRSLQDSGTRGYYWSRSLVEDITYSAWCHNFGSDYMHSSSNSRSNGISVRAVRIPQD